MYFVINVQWKDTLKIKNVQNAVKRPEEYLMTPKQTSYKTLTQF